MKFNLKFSGHRGPVSVASEQAAALGAKMYFVTNLAPGLWIFAGTTLYFLHKLEHLLHRFVFFRSDNSSAER